MKKLYLIPYPAKLNITAGHTISNPPIRECLSDAFPAWKSRMPRRNGTPERNDGYGTRDLWG